MPGIAGAKILLADDDQSLVRTLSWILKHEGYEVVVAPGGEGLLSKLEEERPHLLLLDIMMPQVDGLQLLQISKCSMVLAKPGDQFGLVVAAYENPMLRNLQVELARYPEIQGALASGRPVLVADVGRDPLYEQERLRWQREGVHVATHSAV